MDTTPAESKRFLRERMIPMRGAVPPEMRQAWSDAICRKVCASDAFERASHVVSYLPMGAEVDPSGIASVALGVGRAVYVPAGDGEPRIVPMTGGAPPRTFGPHTGNQPHGGRGVLFLVPGVAFDLCGRRLGRGYGWYDRLLAGYPQADRWGLAFGLQLVTEVPVDPWDVPMDAVVTESGRQDCDRSFFLPEGTAR